jgi:hypothetical protein
MSDDPNYVAKLEKAISEKYGEEAIQNPKKLWNKEKEQKYLKDLKEFYSRETEKRESERQRTEGGILISKRILEKESNRECPVCVKYSFAMKDDLYMSKFQCCFDCYIHYVEGREARWRSGWRPDKNTMAIMK